jgi:hypothetical protein
VDGIFWDGFVASTRRRWIFVAAFRPTADGDPAGSSASDVMKLSAFQVLAYSVSLSMVAHRMGVSANLEIMQHGLHGDWGRDQFVQICCFALHHDATSTLEVPM